MKIKNIGITNNIILVILGSAFFVPLASFMITPYLTIILTKTFHLNILYVGIFLGVANFLQFGLSIFSEFIKKRLGVYYGVLMALLLRNIGFSLFFFLNKYLVVTGLLLSSIGASLYLPLAKSIIVDFSLINDKKKNLAIFGALINAGMFFGPLIGGIFLNLDLFHVLILTNVIIIFIIFVISYITLSKLRNHLSNSASLSHVTMIDHQLILVLFIQGGFFCCFIAYQNFLPLYLSTIHKSWIMIAATCASFIGILQILLTKYINLISWHLSILIAFLFLVVGFGLMYINANLHLYILLLCIILFSLGEIIMTLKVDFLISENNVNLYLFSISNFSIGLGVLLGNSIAGFSYKICSIYQNTFWLHIMILTIMWLILYIILYSYSKIRLKAQ